MWLLFNSRVEMIGCTDRRLLLPMMKKMIIFAPMKGYRGTVGGKNGWTSTAPSLLCLMLYISVGCCCYFGTHTHQTTSEMKKKLRRAQKKPTVGGGGGRMEASREASRERPKRWNWVASGASTTSHRHCHQLAAQQQKNAPHRSISISFFTLWG
jgi:hypothetical protein